MSTGLRDRDKEAERQVPKSDLDALVGTGAHDGVARVSAKRRLLGGNRLQGFEASLKQCFGMKVPPPLCAAQSVSHCSRVFCGVLVLAGRTARSCTTT